MMLLFAGILVALLASASVRAAVAYLSSIFSTIMKERVSKKLSSVHEGHASVLLTASMVCLFSMRTDRAKLSLIVSDIAVASGLPIANAVRGQGGAEESIFKRSSACIKQPHDEVSVARVTQGFQVESAWTFEVIGDAPDDTLKRSTAEDVSDEAGPLLMPSAGMRSDTMSFLFSVKLSLSSTGSPKGESIPEMTSEPKSARPGNMLVSPNTEKTSEKSCANILSGLGEVGMFRF
jgi:hypothetical protein